jgi:hypothetical protein
MKQYEDVECRKTGYEMDMNEYRITREIQVGNQFFYSVRLSMKRSSTYKMDLLIAFVQLAFITYKEYTVYKHLHSHLDIPVSVFERSTLVYF